MNENIWPVTTYIVYAALFLWVIYLILVIGRFKCIKTYKRLHDSDKLNKVYVRKNLVLAMMGLFRTQDANDWRRSSQKKKQAIQDWIDNAVLNCKERAMLTNLLDQFASVEWWRTNHTSNVVPDRRYWDYRNVDYDATLYAEALKDVLDEPDRLLACAMFMKIANADGELQGYTTATVGNLFRKLCQAIGLSAGQLSDLMKYAGREDEWLANNGVSGNNLLLLEESSDAEVEIVEKNRYLMVGVPGFLPNFIKNIFWKNYMAKGGTCLFTLPWSIFYVFGFAVGVYRYSWAYIIAFFVLCIPVLCEMALVFGNDRPLNAMPGQKLLTYMRNKAILALVSLVGVGGSMLMMVEGSAYHEIQQNCLSVNRQTYQYIEIGTYSSSSCKFGHNLKLNTDSDEPVHFKEWSYPTYSHGKQMLYDFVMKVASVLHLDDSPRPTIVPIKLDLEDEKQTSENWINLTKGQKIIMKVDFVANLKSVYPISCTYTDENGNESKIDVDIEMLKQ